MLCLSARVRRAQESSSPSGGGGAESPAPIGIAVYPLISSNMPEAGTEGTLDPEQASPEEPPKKD
jgi:hypothetical protein